MQIRKRVEQEIEVVKAKFINRPVFGDGYTQALEDVLEWIEEEKPKRKSRFMPPKYQEVVDEFMAKGAGKREADNETYTFINFYSSKNWMVGKNKMTNWKSAVAGWVNRNKKADKNYKTMDNDQLYAEATSLGIPTQGKSTFDLRAALEATA